MAGRDFNASELFRQMEQDFMRSAESAMRIVMYHPHLDMYETAESLVIKMELAGVKPDRLQITLSADDRRLTITGERQEAQEDHPDRLRCHHLEIFYGEFSREVNLPANIRLQRENIKATYKDGFLTISLPKKDELNQETCAIIITTE